MSGKFNENLSAFLTSCREAAMRELTNNNAEYKKLLADNAGFSKKIEIALPDEHEVYTDHLLAMSRMERNYLYLQGFKDCVSLYKRFDGSFAESEDFEKAFI